MLRSITEKIAEDLNQGIKDNDYIEKENAVRLFEAVAELEKCGVLCFGMDKKIVELSWFVGGDKYKILELQRKLNQLGIKGKSGRLLEDGVYGRETLYAWNSFLNRLAGGVIPTLNWVNPLQSDITEIKSMPIKNGTTATFRDFSSRSLNEKGTTVFRADVPHKGADYFHINTVEGKTVKTGEYVTPNKLQSDYNHFQITEDVYNKLRRFDSTAKKVRAGSRILLIVGIALDALELGLSIYNDINDDDGKLGKKTVQTTAQIVGRWTGAIAGAKIGAIGGATIGTMIFPGPGTAIGGIAGGLIIGIVGAFAGDKLAEMVVDITYTGD